MCNFAKTQQEIEYIRQASGITDKCFTHLLNFIKKGMTEREIASEIERFVLKNGAEGLSFDTIVASGENGCMPHAEVSDRRIVHGDAVTIDMGCKVSGYCSDMTRTIFIGEIAPWQKEIYNIVFTAQEMALNMLKSGVSCADADRTARNFIEAKGYGEFFLHTLGHGIGTEVHEEPRLSVKSEVVLEGNFAVTVEPGIYLEGKGGVRIEDTVVILSGGILNLNESSKDILII